MFVQTKDLARAMSLLPTSIKFPKLGGGIGIDFCPSQGEVRFFSEYKGVKCFVGVPGKTISSRSKKELRRITGLISRAVLSKVLKNTPEFEVKGDTFSEEVVVKGKAQVLLRDIITLSAENKDYSFIVHPFCGVDVDEDAIPLLNMTAASLGLAETFKRLSQTATSKLGGFISFEIDEKEKTLFLRGVSPNDQKYREEILLLDKIFSEGEQGLAFTMSPSIGKIMKKMSIQTETHWEVFPNALKIKCGPMQVVAPLERKRYPRLASLKNRKELTAIVVNPQQIQPIVLDILKVNEKVPLWLFVDRGFLYFISESSKMKKIARIKVGEKTPPCLAVVKPQNLHNREDPLATSKQVVEVCLQATKLQSLQGKSPSLQPLFVQIDGEGEIAIAPAISKINWSEVPREVRDWAISNGVTVPIGDSETKSESSYSVADVLSDTWNVPGWHKPRLVKCECGEDCDLNEIAPENSTVGYCEQCEITDVMSLKSVAWACEDCYHFHRGEKAPANCKNCGSSAFYTVHKFGCRNCGTESVLEDFKACQDCRTGNNYDGTAPLSAVALFHCQACDSRFDETEVYFDGDEVPPCPNCGSNKVSENLSYWCDCCGSAAYYFYIPDFAEPAESICPSCDRTLDKKTARSPENPFVINGTFQI